MPADTAGRDASLSSQSRIAIQRYRSREGSAECDLWRTPVHHGDRAIKHNAMWAPNLAFGDVDVETEVLKLGGELVKIVGLTRQHLIIQEPDLSFQSWEILKSTNDTLDSHGKEGWTEGVTLLSTLGRP